MEIIQKFITSNNFRIGRRDNIKYIVIHDTGTPGATAQNEHDYFNNNNNLQVSAHYFVDKDVTIQIVDDANTAWHCGDGGGKFGVTNDNSIGVELCIDRQGSCADSWQNGIELTCQLLARYGLGIDSVVRHFDASRKTCPASMSANGWVMWNDFVSDVTASVNAQSGGGNPDGGKQGGGNPDGGGTPDTSNLTPNTSAHWAKQYLDSLVKKGIVQSPEAWADFDAPVTKGLMLAIVDKATK